MKFGSVFVFTVAGYDIGFIEFVMNLPNKAVPKFTQE
jgi:hypothetical protein